MIHPEDALKVEEALAGECGCRLGDICAHDAKALEVLRAEVRRLQAANERLRGANKELREVMIQTVNDLQGTNYTMSIVRKEVEKIEGLNWEGIYKSWDDIYDSTEEALTIAALSENPK